MYFIAELVYADFPDPEHFRKPLPPPLDYPDKVFTPDSKWYKAYKENLNYKLAMDNGDVGKPVFEIIDGKKVYNKFAGINNRDDGF